MRKQLRAFKPVKPGDDLFDVVNANWINSVQEAIFALFRGDNIMGFVGGRIRKFSDGFSLFVDAAGNGNGGGSKPTAFTFMGIDSDGNLTIFPGAVNQLLVSSPLDTVSVASGTTYIYLKCETDTNQVNSVEYQTGETPPSPPAAVLGAPPTTFNVLLGFVVQTTDGSGNNVYTMYQTWNAGNVIATPSLWMQTDRDTPEPYQSFFENWYSWEVQGDTPIISD